MQEVESDESAGHMPVAGNGCVIRLSPQLQHRDRHMHSHGDIQMEIPPNYEVVLDKNVSIERHYNEGGAFVIAQHSYESAHTSGITGQGVEVEATEIRETVINGSTLNGHHSQENDDDDSKLSEENDEAKSSDDEALEDLQTDKWGFIQKENEEEDSSKAGSKRSDVEVPVAVLRKREMKWLQMFENWPYYMSKHFEKVRERCRKGIPPSLRARAWMHLSGGLARMRAADGQSPHGITGDGHLARYGDAASSSSTPQSIRRGGSRLMTFEECDAAVNDDLTNDEIRRDIHRQFPNHELFARKGAYGKLGQEDLFRLLKAYTVLHPEEGYCQAQAPVAATLLMHMPLKEAFYCFCQICESYLPGYYSDGLAAVQLDGDILFRLLKKTYPRNYKLLKKLEVNPALYVPEWFMCVFCRTLPWSAVLRVWDMFFCEGVKILFRIGLVLLRHGLNAKEIKEMSQVVERLKRLPENLLHESFLLPAMFDLGLHVEDFQAAHRDQLDRRRKEERLRAKLAEKEQKKSNKR